MSANSRFALDEQRKVIDAVNVVNSGKGYCHEGDREDDKHLRVLMVRLDELIRKLSMQKSHAIWCAMLYTIEASHLNTFDPALSLQHRFDGKLRRQRNTRRISHPLRFSAMMLNVFCATYISPHRTHLPRPTRGPHPANSGLAGPVRAPLDAARPTRNFPRMSGNAHTGNTFDVKGRKAVPNGPATDRGLRDPASAGAAPALRA
jgi:hypothetical protein